MAETLFYWCFGIVVVATLILTAIQPALLSRLQREAPIVYADTGSPSVMYFLVGSWLGFGRYARALLGFRISRAAGVSSLTARLSTVTSVLFYVLIGGWLIGIVALLSTRT